MVAPVYRATSEIAQNIGVAAGAVSAISIILFVCLNFAAHSAGFRASEEAIRQQVERLRTAETTREETVEIAAIIAFYTERRFAPVWDTVDRWTNLLAAIEHVTTQGLKPEVYGHQRLSRHIDEGALADTDYRHKQSAHMDIVATRTLFRILRDLHFGKVDRQAQEPNLVLEHTDDRGESLSLLPRAMQYSDLRKAVDMAVPDHALYKSLRKELLRYQSMEENWPQFPEGPYLKPGMTDNRLAALRKRLTAEGIRVAENVGLVDTYDTLLLGSVKLFQTRHGLDPDGIVGPKTRAALNIPLAMRIDQIRINLERGRWLLQDVDRDLIAVNIAGYKLFLLEDGNTVWKTNIVVGQPYRKTPVFKADLRYLVLNPTWTVPPTLLRVDKLPKIAKDVSYLVRHNMSVVDAQGTKIDSSTIDWARASNYFPYQLVQAPGPDNSLGQVKFIFPNHYSVYLHDTPNKELFSRSARAFSSGCIRVEKPLELAARILASQDWSLEKIEQEIANGKTQTVMLDSPMSVLIMYWTVHPQEDGSLHFFSDIYNRDQAILKELDEISAF